MPAQAGIQIAATFRPERTLRRLLDPRFRGDDSCDREATRGSET